MPGFGELFFYDVALGCQTITMYLDLTVWLQFLHAKTDRTRSVWRKPPAPGLSAERQKRLTEMVQLAHPAWWTCSGTNLPASRLLQGLLGDLGQWSIPPFVSRAWGGELVVHYSSYLLTLARETAFHFQGYTAVSETQPICLNGLLSSLSGCQ